MATYREEWQVGMPSDYNDPIAFGLRCSVIDCNGTLLRKETHEPIKEGLSWLEFLTKSTDRDLVFLTAKGKEHWEERWKILDLCFRRIGIKSAEIPIDRVHLVFRPDYLLAHTWFVKLFLFNNYVIRNWYPKNISPVVDDNKLFLQQLNLRYPDIQTIHANQFSLKPRPWIHQPIPDVPPEGRGPEDIEAVEAEPLKRLIRPAELVRD